MGRLKRKEEKVIDKRLNQRKERKVKGKNKKNMSTSHCDSSILILG